VVRDLIEKGLQQHQAGHFESAQSFYEQALAIQPQHPDALHLAGVAALQCGQVDRAVDRIEQATRQQPDNPGFHANLAQAYLALRRVADALASFRRAAALNPREPQFAVGTANCLAMQGRLAEAEQMLRGLLQRHPELVLAWLNLARAVGEQGRLEEAAGLYRRAIELDPGFADAYIGLGNMLHALERIDEAEQAFRQHLALRPGSEAGSCNLASVLIDLGRFAEAAALCRQALAGLPASLELHLMLGSALVHEGRIADALDSYRHAANLAPDNPRACLGCGYMLVESGRHVEGTEWLKRVVECQPDAAEFREVLSAIRLSLGDWQTGWEDYAWRTVRLKFFAENPGLRLADELPENLSGVKICLLSEQGLGDELFFLRFTQELRAGGAEIFCQSHEKLASILGRVPALARLLPRDEPPPDADVILLAGDLPYALGRRAHATFGTPPPLSLSALPRQLDEMKRQLEKLGPPPYRGVTWRAGTAPAEQRGRSWALHKEIGLEKMGAVLREVDGTWLALQRHPRPGEIGQLASCAGRPVHDLSACNEDLENMLALLALLDDYVGVSNTNMHLRAGTGKTARLLLPRPSEWRWMADGKFSPWFPGFRIYRQSTNGSWADALQALSKDLLTTAEPG